MPYLILSLFAFLLSSFGFHYYTTTPLLEHSFFFPFFGGGEMLYEYDIVIYHITYVVAFDAICGAIFRFPYVLVRYMYTYI